MKIILFDGVCNLCNGLVNWVIEHDKRSIFRFSALQSDYGKQAVLHFKVQGDYMNTFILLDEDKALYRSTAILMALKYLGGIYSLTYAFIIVPSFIRNAVYNLVAKYRYRWFGKRESCMVPTPQLKSKFLE